MKKVWLVSHYGMPPHLEVRIKTLRYAEILQERGYEVLLITASTVHNTDIDLIETKEKFVKRSYGNLDYVHIKCSKYNGSGIKRIKNLLQFQRRFQKVMKKFEKPDVIVADCNCINYKGILSFAEKYKIPFVTEVRDLWPLSIVEYKNISEKNPVIQYLYAQEKKMYRRSDAIVFSMEGGKKYIQEKKWDHAVDLNKVFSINNGLDVELQDEQRREYRLVDSDLTDSCFKVIYAGSIRTANSLDLLVQAAELLKEKTNIKFLIYGDGDKREELERYCDEREISSVKFKGSIDKKYIPYVCAMANVNVISVKQTRISRYGVSWNKLFDYMNAGKPILSTAKVNYDLIEKYECGISLENQFPQTIAAAVLQIYEMPPEDYARMCDHAKQAAKDFDYSYLTTKLEEVMSYAVEHYDKR